jgi:hypothetical protein
MTAGILTIACHEGEVELEIEPSAFLSAVDDPAQSHPPYSTDPDFQPYFAKAWASYKANRTVKEKHMASGSTLMVSRFLLAHLGRGSLMLLLWRTR